MDHTYAAGKETSLMHVVQASIEISAEGHEVWEVLRDLKRYPEWNPFLTAIKGEPEVGSKIKVTAQLKGSRCINFNARLLDCSEEKGIRWYGRLCVPFLFAGEHSFNILKTDNGVQLVQLEKFTGLAVPFLRRGLLDGSFRQGYEDMNRALKARCEKSD